VPERKGILPSQQPEAINRIVLLVIIFKDLFSVI